MRTKGIILLFAMAVICACKAPHSNSTPHANDTSNTENNILAKYGKDITPRTFATALFDRACKNTEKENICISPASTAWTLGMLANGADGNTLAQIIGMLGHDNIDSLNNRQKEQAATITKGDTSVTAIISNSIWINNKLAVKAPFVDRTSIYYDATINTRKFDNATLRDINDWCAQKTNGKINSILSKLDNRTKMLLLNALYFKATWSRPFNARATTEHPFAKENGDTTMVAMMNQRIRTAYFENDTVQMAYKPFGDGNFSMLFIVPQPSIGMQKTTAALIDKFDHWHAQMQEGTNVNLGLPKFSTEYDTSLKTALCSMSITDAFGPSANFSQISASPLYVDDIIQKCYIKIDEEGAEAAAVTMASMQLLSARPTESKQMIIDRPFIFVITENITKENNILFIGKIGNPNNKI